MKSLKDEMGNRRFTFDEVVAILLYLSPTWDIENEDDQLAAVQAAYDAVTEFIDVEYHKETQK